MTDALVVARLGPRVGSFDEVVARYSDARISFSEIDALQASHWAMGEDARLREDVRFRLTPWDRWILSRTLLANDSLHSRFLRGSYSEVDLLTALAELSEETQRTCVFCAGDDRFVLADGRLRLSAKELSDRPLVEDHVTELEKYVTHLPLQSLKAAAAAEPVGEWGPTAREDSIDALGWVRVDLPDRRRLNNRMFVARIEGNSMDDGRSGLVDSAFAVFELWPAGTRQNLIVLVRGAFRDPETGSYAVKKYVSDRRDEQRRHHRITLRSLHPDKERFPDIECQIEQEEDVTVVAKLVHALSKEQIARKPKTPRRAGRRNLSDPDQREARVEKVRGRLGRFFDEAPTTVDDGRTGEVEWRARLVCLDEDSAGLCVETRPMSWIPPFAKKLAIETVGHKPAVLLASNLRVRTGRCPIPPTTTPYRWSAPGNEEMLGEELAALELPGLPGDRPSLFRVDAAGVGQPMVGQTVSAGSGYRLLLPPGIGPDDLPPGMLHHYPSGWRLWELSVPTFPSDDLRQLLSEVGFEIGRPVPYARWVLRSPTGYDFTRRGEAYPIFLPTYGPVVSVGGLRSSRAGEVMLLAVGDEKSITFPLPPGDSWTVELEDLVPGRFMLQVLHERTRFAPVTLPFSITNATNEAAIRALVTVSKGATAIAPQDDRSLSVDLDLATSEERDRLVVEAPPLWPFDVEWDDGRKRRIGRTHASPGGVFDLSSLETRLSETLPRCPLATLTLDGGELGLLEIRHRRRVTVSAVRSQLELLVRDRLESAAALDGQFALLRNLWLHPVLELLGYGYKDGDEAELAEAQPGTTGLQLIERYREAGRIRSETSRALVLVTAASDLNSSDMFSARRFADALCQRWKVREALLTDGVRWAKHRRHVHVPLRVFRIDEAVKASDLFTFSEFLSEFAVAAMEE